MNTLKTASLAVVLAAASHTAMTQQATSTDLFLALMTAAHAHATAHGVKVAPVLSPNDATLLGASPAVNVASLHAAGFRVIPWTTNDPAKMRALIALHVDGIISDRPDILQTVLLDERKAATGNPTQLAYLKSFVVSAHRGGRGLRPENTLPSFEDGLDHLATELETDTGISNDHVSLIWHDQFYNPLSCRRADGKPYTLDKPRLPTRYLLHRRPEDLRLRQAAPGPRLRARPVPRPDQRPYAVARRRGLRCARAPHQPLRPHLRRATLPLRRVLRRLLCDGAGKSHPDAKARAANARTVRFNLETKILPPLSPAEARAAGEPDGNHTVDPQTFVATLCGAIVRSHMESRAEVQSFDFRTLQLVEEQFPSIPTYYLTGLPATLSSPLVPAALRQR